MFNNKFHNTKSRNHNAEIASSEQSLNVPQAAEYLGIHPRTLDNWRSQHRGPRYIRLGRRIVYRVGDVEAYLEAHAVDPEAT